MGDVTHTEAWKKQERPLQIVATNQQVRELERFGYAKDGKMRLGALYMHVVEHAMELASKEDERWVEAVNQNMAAQADKQRDWNFNLLCLVIVSIGLNLCLLFK